MSSARHWDQDKEATVYIGNLDERVTDKLVWELMLQAGRIVNVHLPKDRVLQNHQGYGFVEFISEEDAEYASKIMNGVRLFGKPIRVNKASADKQKSLDVGAELFIGNLDSMVTESALYDTFSQFGTLIAPPKIARDENNLSKGYGFVSYSSFEASDDAIETMNGKQFMNREINVQYAYKKDGQGKRHGDLAERKLAEEARKHNVIPVLPPAGVVPGPIPYGQQQQQLPPQHLQNPQQFPHQPATSPAFPSPGVHTGSTVPGPGMGIHPSRLQAGMVAGIPPHYPVPVPGQIPQMGGPMGVGGMPNHPGRVPHSGAFPQHHHHPPQQQLHQNRQPPHHQMPGRHQMVPPPGAPVPSGLPPGFAHPGFAQGGVGVGVPGGAVPPPPPPPPGFAGASPAGFQAPPPGMPPGFSGVPGMNRR